MKKFLLVALALTAGYSFAQTTHNVTTSGFAFSPSTLTITQGDTIAFTSNGHSMTEVSQTTWDNNQSTSNGGFDTGVLSGQTVKFKVNNNPGTVYFVCTPHAAGGMKGTITVEAPLDINENSTVELKMYPNPSTGIVSLKGTGYEYLEVHNIMGQRILSQGKGQTSIDLTNEADGVYFVSIYSGDDKVMTTQKVVLRK